MDYSKIKDLIKTIEESNLMDFELKVKGEIYIRMNKSGVQAQPVKEKKSVMSGESTPAVTETVKEVKAEVEEISEPMTIIPEEKVEVKAGNVVTSPMVGTFYQSSAPDKPPYVKVGDKVKAGDVLCVIEAMKIMNEITSAYDGEVAEIMVSNQDMVEYNQPLFRIV